MKNKKLGRHAYVIPEGASNALGAWGYVRSAEELASDLAELPDRTDKPTTIIHATGSGGTNAGLVLGARMVGLRARLACVNVCDDRDYFLRTIGDICEDFITEFNLDLPFSREHDLEIIDGYVGRGYGLSRREELSLIRDVARTEGIFLDPVYTGKAFFGMTQELSRDPHRFGERIVFVHTGGIFSLFPKADEIAPLL